MLIEFVWVCGDRPQCGLKPVLRVRNSALGSAVIHKSYLVRVKDIKTANIYITIQHWGEARWELNSKR